MLKKKLNKKGFSLIELIIVIAIMAILAAIIIPTVTSKIKDANDGSANTTASTIANSIKSEIISINSNLTSNLTYLDTSAANTLKVKASADGSKYTVPESLAKLTADGTTIYAKEIAVNTDGTSKFKGEIIVQCKVGNSDTQIYVINAATGAIEHKNDYFDAAAGGAGGEG